MLLVKSFQSHGNPIHSSLCRSKKKKNSLDFLIKNINTKYLNRTLFVNNYFSKVCGILTFGLCNWKIISEEKQFGSFPIKHCLPFPSIGIQERTGGPHHATDFTDAYETCLVPIPGTITLASVFKAVRSFHILRAPELSSYPGCHASPCWLTSADCTDLPGPQASAQLYSPDLAMLQGL